MAVDYRALLRKYVMGVGSVEGSDFIDLVCQGGEVEAGWRLTEEEQEVLRHICDMPDQPTSTPASTWDEIVGTIRQHDAAIDAGQAEVMRLRGELQGLEERLATTLRRVNALDAWSSKVERAFTS